MKPEPQDGGGGLDNSDSEELSEGEELRRAAHAYASTSKQPAQPEVIVLDDSSDDDVPPPPPKRPHLGAPTGSTNGRIPHPAANGASSRPFQVPLRLVSFFCIRAAIALAAGRTLQTDRSERVI